MNAHKKSLSIFSGRTLMATSVLLALLAGCGGGGGGGSGGNGGGSGGGSTRDPVPPTVTAMTPGEDSTGLATNGKLTATLSEAMVPALINTDNFRLNDGTGYLAGTVSYDATNRVAVFTPAAGFAANSRYTATVVTGIKDVSGNPITLDFAWCFVTGSGPDNTAPGVTSSFPVNAATGVAINRNISARFGEDMDSSTITSASFTLTGPGAVPVTGSVTYLGRAAVFAPAADLAPLTVYTATITTAVRDLAGNASQSNVAWSFTTGNSADINGPSVVSTSPNNFESNVAISRTISVTLSEPMDPTTVTTANFTVTGPGPAFVVGTVAYDAASNTATFTRIHHLTTPVTFHPTPVSYLDPGTTYTATFSTGARDMAGLAMTTDLVWSFTTAP